MSTKTKKINNEVKQSSATKEKQAPKWGTAEWIMAYPWSKMDRSRRRRVRALLNDDELLSQKPSVCGWLKEGVLKEFKSNGINVEDKTLQGLMKSAAKIDDFLVCAHDVLVSAALAKRWGIMERKDCNDACKSTKCKKCKKDKKA